MESHKHWDEVSRRSQEPRPVSEQQRQRADGNRRSREEWERANPQVNPRPKGEADSSIWDVITRDPNE